MQQTPTPSSIATSATPPKPQPAQHFEDGNSAFSRDLLQDMNAENLQHYSRTFYQVMENNQTGQTHQWQFGNDEGALMPQAPFTNNSGATCRPFHEILKVKNTQQTLSGIACQQKGGGWCKLRSTSTPACDLGRKEGIGSWWFDTKRDLLR